MPTRYHFLLSLFILLHTLTLSLQIWQTSNLSPLSQDLISSAYSTTNPVDQNTFTFKSPFPIIFFGSPYNYLYISSNSYISFGICTEINASKCSGTPRIAISNLDLVLTNFSVATSLTSLIITYKGFRYPFYYSEAVQWSLIFYKTDDQRMVFDLKVTSNSISVSISTPPDNTIYSKTSAVAQVDSRAGSGVRYQGCRKGCDDCDNTLTCTRCMQKYIMNSRNNTCTPDCDDGCLFCDTPKLCITCDDGYFLSSESVCYACSQGCKSCQSSSTCSACFDGYTLGRSYPFCSPVSLSTTSIVLIVCGCLIAISSACSIGCCIYKRYFQKDDDEYSEEPTSATIVIERKIREILNKSIFVKNPQLRDTEMCSVCLQTRTSVQTTCGHLFHLSCIADWFSKQRNCPVCRCEDFALEILCQGCKCFYKTIEMCSQKCREKNHIICYLRRSRIHHLCQNCRENPPESIRLETEAVYVA